MHTYIHTYIYMCVWHVLKEHVYKVKCMPSRLCIHIHCRNHKHHLSKWCMIIVPFHDFPTSISIGRDSHKICKYHFWLLAGSWFDKHIINNSTIPPFRPCKLWLLIAIKTNVYIYILFEIHIKRAVELSPAGKSQTNGSLYGEFNLSYYCTCFCGWWFQPSEKYESAGILFPV